MKVNLSIKPLVIALSLFGATAALADINIGVSVSATGPAVVLGGPGGPTHGREAAGRPSTRRRPPAASTTNVT